MALLRRFRPSSERSGVLLVAFGGPESLDEVPRFVESVLGRPPPHHVLEEVVDRYGAVGGRSPLPDTTRLQARLLEGELRRRGIDWKVYVGMLHAEPSVDQAAEEIRRDEMTRLIAVGLTPYRCEVSTDAYEEAVQHALGDNGAAIDLLFPDDWNLHPGYVEALSTVLGKALAESPAALATPVVFSAHSLPVRMIEQGDPYDDQLLETARAVAGQVGVERWELAYQSVSAAAAEPWLGPPVEEVLDRLSAEGHEAVCVYPIGFLADHLETLYDNDVEHRRHAEELGLAFVRPPCLNDHPRLITALGDLVAATAGRD